MFQISYFRDLNVLYNTLLLVGENHTLTAYRVLQDLILNLSVIKNPTVTYLSRKTRYIVKKQCQIIC